MNTTIARLRWLCLLPVLLLSVTARAQGEFTLTELTLEPVLPPMTGGGFTMVVERVGDTPITAQGGGFALVAEVASVLDAVVLGDVAVSIAIEGDSVILTWSGAGDGLVLETASALDLAPDWRPVVPAPAGRRFIAPAAGGAVFFRLRAP